MGIASTGENNKPRPNPQRNSAFRRDGNPRMRKIDYDDLPTEPVPRVLPKDEDPSLVKRNRRMLGLLLGTLKKFREEDKQLSTTEAYMRRSDSLRRADERAREESERLWQQELRPYELVLLPRQSKRRWSCCLFFDQSVIISSAIF